MDSGCFHRTRPLRTVILAGLASCLLPSYASAQPTQLYWGDTHLHTSWSVDAWSNGNTTADPDTAYRFAKGLPVLHPATRERIRIDRPLDFLVVADHAEMLMTQTRLLEQDAELLATPAGQRMRGFLDDNPRGFFLEVMQASTGGAQDLLRDFHNDRVRAGSWQAQIDAAERHNSPGQFTAFIGWEWSSGPNGRNLHRVIFTPSGAAEASRFLPYSSYESERPEDLWRWLGETSARSGADFIAIPHNSNLSDGLMFDRVDSAGRPLTAEYARERMRWEPVMEVAQVKGTSETHPLLSPSDEFAAFEIRNKLLGGQPALAAEGAYARGALLRGLEIEPAIGVNPYKLGLIGSTDSHTGLASVEENNFFGKNANDTLPEQRLATRGVGFAAWEMSAAGLAAVWAADNTRAALAAAFKRKEVYATSGPRIALRVFAGYDFNDDDARSNDIAGLGYARGVPMGGDLSRAPEGQRVALLIQAVKDPLGANLDRVQVVKGWIDAAGARQERVYDVAWSGARQPDTDGVLAAVGTTVDETSARYDNSIGAAELVTVWRDPDFDPALRSFYYVRVLEIPTPRHSLFDAVALGIDPAATQQPTSLQERAWSSPIWYTP
jgi:hypothetical protein